MLGRHPARSGPVPVLTALDWSALLKPADLETPMKFFIDTANVADIRRINEWGILDGVTTNPSLIAKESGKPFEAIIEEICSIVDGPISAEVIALDAPTMIKEGRLLSKIHKNVRGQGAPHRRRAQGHPRLQGRRHPDQRDPLLQRHPGPDGRQGGRHLRLALRGPAGRHQPWWAWSSSTS